MSDERRVEFTRGDLETVVYAAACFALGLTHGDTLSPVAKARLAAAIQRVGAEVQIVFDPSENRN